MINNNLLYGFKKTF